MMSRNMCRFSRLHNFMGWSSVRNVTMEPLPHRSLMKLTGPDACSFLQGMVTNDVSSFEDKTGKYAVVLNTSGRVLCDCLLYKLGENQYLLECDQPAAGFLQKHFNMYKLRKKVDIQLVDDLRVWVALLDSAPASSDVAWLESTEGVRCAIPDPRLQELGFRLITSSDHEFNESRLFAHIYRTRRPYARLRYKLGVGEGVKDHPPAQCLPSETNVDILNGVSFDKGCYIGQEMTAKIHHTGVVRKRLMPITLLPEQEDYPGVEAECLVVNDKGQRVGRLRHNIGKYGLAALNVEEAMKTNKLLLKGLDFQIVPSIPAWWPPDVAKISSLSA